MIHSKEFTNHMRLDVYAYIASLHQNLEIMIMLWKRICSISLELNTETRFLIVNCVYMCGVYVQMHVMENNL